MPLYEFKCKDCGQEFERLVRREPAAGEVECPGCQGRQVVRALSLPAAPVNSSQPGPSACGVGPPCGAPWCQRPG